MLSTVFVGMSDEGLTLEATPRLVAEDRPWIPDDSVPAEVADTVRDHPDRKRGRFVLVRQIGKGGVGTVWKGWDIDLRRWVALKFLSRHLTKDDLDRFRWEASVAGQLDHPGIATVYDVGLVGGAPAIVMKYIDGRTLDALYMREPACPADLVSGVAAIRDAALAVGNAHSRGFVHRDLKPGNIMVDGQGQVYVLDFGLADAIYGPRLAATLNHVGTPAYMAPEQARGCAREIDARTDVYGLGVTLWTILAGRRPFIAGSVVDLLMMIAEGPVPSLGSVRADVPEELEAILATATALRPRDRYPMALNLAAHLHQFLARHGRPADAACTKVLLASDDATVLGPVRALLPPAGMDVVTCRSAASLVESREHSGAELVIVDADLPGLENLGRIGAGASRPFATLLVTSAAGVTRLDQMPVAGAVDFMMKPLAEGELLPRIRRLLARR